MLHQLITAAYIRHAATGRPLERPLLIALDEAANIAPLDELDTLASTAAGTGIQLLTIFQDKAQIETRYGTRAATVVNNHRAKIWLSGVSDEPSLRYLATLLGEGHVTQDATSTDTGGRRSTSTSQTFRPLATADQLRQIPANQGVLVYGALPPARLALRPYYQDRHHKRLASEPTTPSGELVA